MFFRTWKNILNEEQLSLDGKRIIFVNGYLAVGSPSGGSTYWGGSNSAFVRGAQNFFRDTHTPFFTNYDHSYFRSGKNITRSDGYEYAKANYSKLTRGMNIEEDNFRFVTHSMGGAFSDVEIQDKNLIIQIYNETSRSSLMLHIGSNYDRVPNSEEQKPLSTIKQYIKASFKLETNN